VVQHSPEAAATIGNLVKISSELAFGVQHADRLRGALENCAEGLVETRHS